MTATLVAHQPTVTANRAFDGRPSAVARHEVECEAILKYTRRLYAAWQDEPGEGRWKMSQVPADLRDALADLADTFASGPISERMMPLLHWAERVATGFVTWAGQRNWQDEQPPGELTQAFARLCEARDAMDVPPREVPPLESIARLDKEGVSIKQIGIMWQLTEAVVARELREPGLHVPAGYLPPSHRPEALAAAKIDYSKWTSGSMLAASVAIIRRMRADGKM